MALSRSSMAEKKRKLADLSVDEFMTGGFESSSSESEKQVRTKMKNKQKISKKAAKTKTSVKHGTSLKERLANQDPEFLEFLQDEDEALLEYKDDLSDSEDDSSKTDDVGNTNNDSDDDIDLPQSSDEDEIVEAILSKKKAKLAAKSKDDNKSKSGKDDKKMEKTKKDKQKKKNKENESSTVSKTVDKTNTTQVKDDKKSKKKKDTSNKPDDSLKQVSKEDKSKKKGKKVKEETLTKDSSDDDDDDDDDEDWQEFDMGDVSSDESDDEEEAVHTVPDKLEVMSDSDEDDDGVGDDVGPKKKSTKVKVTMKMIKEWTQRFKEAPSPAVIHDAVYAFKAAVQQTASEAVATKYSVEGSKVFNGVICMCLVEIPAALQKILDLPVTLDLQKAVLPSSKNQKWKKVRVDVKSYLADVLQLLTQLSEANMVNVLLKHVHRLVAFYACYPNLTKVMLKRVIGIWSTGEETSRVLAFLCINRLIRVQQQSLLEPCIKQLYMAYVKNCKFTSPNTLPLINFMQRSLVEILSIDFTLAYQYAFIYIRQLAIHLRNAISTKKKESCQAVYNWQYIHCVGLWTRVMCMTHPNDVLEPLIYPLVQTIIGTIKLVPTQRYYPLRFHCVRALTMITRSTGTFIPVLPFLLERILPTYPNPVDPDEPASV